MIISKWVTLLLFDLIQYKTSIFPKSCNQNTPIIKFSYLSDPEIGLRHKLFFNYFSPTFYQHYWESEIKRNIILEVECKCVVVVFIFYFFQLKMQCVPKLSGATVLPSLGMSDMFLRSSLRNESGEVRHAAWSTTTIKVNCIPFRFDLIYPTLGNPLMMSKIRGEGSGVKKHPKNSNIINGCPLPLLAVDKRPTLCV